MYAPTANAAALAAATGRCGTNHNRATPPSSAIQRIQSASDSDIEASGPQAHAAQEVTLAQGCAPGPQDVVGRRGVEIEIGQRERGHESFRGEGNPGASYFEDHFLPRAGIDGLRR